jgi:Ca2+-binding EF-hand superfamily protein
MTKNTIDKIQKILEETYHTDEYFLDEIEFILAPYWEELTDEDIARLLIESFEIFDTEKQGFILKTDLIEYLTKLGEMPLNKKDFQIMFSMMNHSKQFDYHQFIRKLCFSTSKKRKKKVKRTIK